MSRFQIAGAGLAGALLAIYLGRRGHQVTVFERRPDMRRSAVPRGRSINMALSTRGLHALEEVGLDRFILDQAIPMRGRMIHGRDGSLTFQRYSIHEHECIWSISRNGLNMALLDAAERYPGVDVRFEQRVSGVDLVDGGLILEPALTEGEAGVTEGEAGVPRAEPAAGPPPFAIGADGAHSAIRATMQKLDRFDYHQNYLDWGYKELTMPAGPGGAWAIEKNALHIWPRHDFMLIALPNLDGSFTCTLFLPFEGPDSFAALSTDEAALAFFRREFPDAVPLMPDLAEDFRLNPTSSLIYVRCFPWHHRDKAVLVGDACHAVVPFYGQGMNAAFEDCSVLAGLLDDAGPDADGAAMEQVFLEYETLRKPHADALADLALRNFVEMRSSVASRWFHWRNRVEKTLYRLFPDRFIPLYSMVTFSRIPYAEAIRRQQRQDRLIAGLLAAALGLAVLGAAALAWAVSIRW